MDESNRPEALSFFDDPLKNALDNMIEGCQVVDFEDRYVYANASVLKHAKVSRDALIGKKMTDVFPGIEFSEMYRRLVLCRETRKRDRMENEFSYPDGSKGWFDLSIQPVPEGVLIFSIDISQRKKAELQMQKKMQNLTALRKIDLAIAGSLDLSLTLNIALEQVVSQLSIDAADVLLLNQQTLTLEFSQGIGFLGDGITKSRLGLGEGLPREAVLTKKRFSLKNFSEKLSSLPRANLLRDEGFLVYHATPILAKGKVIGVLEVFEKRDTDHDAEWFNFLDTLAGQIAIGIDSLNMFEGLQTANLELMQAYDATIEGWSRALDLRDKETEGHTQRVTKVSVYMASKMGFTGKDLIQIQRGALLHDIGKMGVPDEILLKPAKLSEEEWIIMKRHPEIAVELLSPIKFLSEALDIPHFHHEKWNGSGYPDGLRGTTIPMEARLFAVVDVWDALRSDRPYRKGLSWNETVRYIEESKGSHFDPTVVGAFKEVMNHGDSDFRQ